MRYAYSSFFLLLLILSACDDVPVSGNKPAVKQGTVPEDATGTSGDFYKRFGGMLDGKAIVLHLHKYGSQVGGYYEYMAGGRPVRLIGTGDSVAGNQYSLAETASGDGNNGNSWLLTLDGKKASGKWTTAANTFTVNLEEAYPAGSCPMNAFFYQEHAQLFRSLPDPHAAVKYGIIWPSQQTEPEAAAFLRAMLATDMKLESSVGPYTALKTRAWRYFGNYRLDLKKVIDSSASEAERKSAAYQYESGFNHFIVYNDQQWLIVEDIISNYTGGAHAMYNTTYQNLDIATSRTWKLQDMITDTAALAPLLTIAARDYFRLKPEEPVESRMLVANVPVTTNVYLTPSGLIFVYNPYDIASYADGVVQLYIPYNKLQPLLTPDFRKRIGLEDNNGTAANLRSGKRRYFYGTNKAA